jgi:hypothetical protein
MLSMYCDGESLKSVNFKKCTYVFIMSGMLTEMQYCFSSADYGGVPGAQDEGKSQAIFSFDKDSVLF